MFRFGRIVGALGRAIPPLLRDLVALAGAGSVVYGVALMFEPAAWIVGGLILVAGAALHAKASAS